SGVTTCGPALARPFLPSRWTPLRVPAARRRRRRPPGLTRESGRRTGVRVSPYRARFLSLAAAAAVMAALAAGCSSNGSSSASNASSTKSPIVIGTSLSLTGDFSADGQAFQKGYKLWVSEVNSKGGILGRPVKLDILNDNSSPTQVVTNYQK